MQRGTWTTVALLSSLALGAPRATGAEDLRNSLRVNNIESVRINLAPAGGGLGFEIELDGGDPRIEPLLALIREAEPGGGHKCPNQGAIRFFMKDGGLVGLGLLPAHQEGVYGLRLYRGETLLMTYRVDRGALLDVLGELDVPTGDPAFRE